MDAKKFADTKLSVFVEKWIFLWFGVLENFCAFSLYRNPDIDDLIFDCLLASMAAFQALDVFGCSLFVGDLNGNHQE